MIIAGDRSGTGKTTITLAILAFLKQRGDRVQSFKVGPDYIDPMFHRAISQRPCRNLDPVLTSEEYIRACFARHTKNVDLAVIEGVMGLFDGISNPDSSTCSKLNDYASTAHIARILNLPVILVLNCSSLSSSIAAIAYGYAHLDPQVKVAGVILNKVASDRHLELLVNAIKTIDLPILGIIKRNNDITIPHRHLGLVPTAELPQIDNTCDRLADLARTCFNWELLLPLLQSPSSPVPLSPRLPVPSSPSYPSLKIAVARDCAFNFYYQDNLDILQELGAELIFWSPLAAETIPKDIQGFYFGGGFPEVFAEELASNYTILNQLKQAISSGIPTYAECGGLMYLCRGIEDLSGQIRGMVGIIPAIAKMQKRLTLGYRQAIALETTPLVKAGQIVRGHEFHHSQLVWNNDAIALSSIWQMQGFHRSSQQFSEGCKIANVHASYLHLHFGKYKFLAENFLERCRNYQS